jgi:hypothetical protein
MRESDGLGFLERGHILLLEWMLMELGAVYNGLSTLWKISCFSLALAFTYHNYNIQSTAGPVIVGFPPTSLRSWSANASVPLGFCMGIPTKKIRPPCGTRAITLFKISALLAILPMRGSFGTPLILAY